MITSIVVRISLLIWDFSSATAKFCLFVIIVEAIWEICFLSSFLRARPVVGSARTPQLTARPCWVVLRLLLQVATRASSPRADLVAADFLRWTRPSSSLPLCWLRLSVRPAGAFLHREFLFVWVSLAPPGSGSRLWFPLLVFFVRIFLASTFIRFGSLLRTGLSRPLAQVRSPSSS
jgi:hypothetical protein